ncbi:FtsX-like permease family protein [Streptomyces azureus]|uniref:ABC3 transporter permease C-terminal domain-containing protein n=1 Tax=Streptomyces azureus TaxID=146537 RepID=A0A0K8PVV6_STRAJ|nr:ABC transporter permease [Streptomyces azureus]GAP51848.1 uncharacterized protein SAZU_6721 [Streptomyces azureus]
MEDSRRDQRLAALRLIGATPGRIAGLTAAEALLTGAAGALLGAVGYAVLLPVAASLPLAGGAWYTADLWIGAPLLLALTAGVVTLVVVSALAGLRQVVVGPLDVARRSRSRGASAVRAVVFVAAAVVGVDDGFVAEGPYDSRQVTATVSGGPAELDRARTALTGLTPDQYPVTTTDVNWSEARFTRDFTTITRVVLVVTFMSPSPRPGSPRPPPSWTAAAPTACCTWPGPHCGSWTPPGTGRR